MKSPSGRRVVWPWRGAGERLSRRDAALLEVVGREASGADQLAAAQRFLAEAPVAIEAWESVGEAYVHRGSHAGHGDWMARAVEVFARTIALDSFYKPPRFHKIELAFTMRDTAVLRRLSAQMSRDGYGRTYERWMIASAPAPAAAEERIGHQQQQVVRGLWASRTGDRPGAVAMLERLQAVDGLDDARVARIRAPHLSILRAELSGTTKRPDRPAVERLDAALRTVPGGDFDLSSHVGNGVLARLREHLGDHAGAQQVLARRYMTQPHVLAPALRDQGRLAALRGDRGGAIRAYRHYLALRADPEPSAQAEAEEVRRELGRLLGRSAR